MVRKSVVSGLVVGLVLGASPIAAAGQQGGFTDVPADNVHVERIERAVELGIVRGTTPTTFAPARSVTRAQVASLLERALEAADVELPPLDGAPTFTDTGAPHEDAIRRLAAAEVVLGKGDGRFDPQAPVTRDQFASLVVRAVAFASPSPLPAAGANPFDDVVEGVHYEAILVANELGLLTGKGDGRFDPRSETRRDQAATVVVRLFDLVVDQRPDPEETEAGEVWALDQGTDLIHVYDGDDDNTEIATIDVRPETLQELGFEDAPTGTNTVPHMIDFDSQERYAFIASTAGGVTIVIDARTKEVVEVLGTGAGTHMAAVTPDDSSVWVAVIGNSEFPRVDNGSQRFTEITFDLGAEDPTFEIGQELLIADLLEPWEDGTEASYDFPSYSAICHQYNVDSTEAWLTLGPGWHQGGLVVVDLVEGDLAHAYDPTEIKGNCGVSVNAERAIVNWSGEITGAGGATADTDGEWYVFDPETYEQIGETKSAEGADAHGVRITPDGSSYWFVNRISDNAIVVDAESLEVVRRYPPDTADAPFLDTPDIIDYSPDGRLVYVSQRGPNPRSGGVHAAAGQEPGVAIIDERTGARVGFIEQPEILSGEGAILNDVHGLGVRTASDEDVAPSAQVATTSSASTFGFDAPRPEPVDLGFHCGLAGAA